MLHYGYAEKMAQPFYLSTGRCEELHPRTSYTQCRNFGVFFVFITSIPMNWGLGLSSSLLLFGSLISVISLVLYYLGRVKRFFYPLNLWTIVNLWNACFFGFFFNGGSHGGIQYYFLLSLLTAVLISEPVPTCLCDHFVPHRNSSSLAPRIPLSLLDSELSKQLSKDIRRRY